MSATAKFGLLQKLVPLGVVRRYARKRTILFQGEVPQSVMLLQKGLVKVYGITSTGDQRTVTLLSEGDVFPMSWVFGKTSVCMYYYEAVTDCTVILVTKDEYQAALDTDTALQKQIFDNYMSHYIGATMHVYALEQSHAQDKLIYILHFLVARFGEKMPDGRFTINLRLSHQDIAEMVGITRETTAVELHRLKDKGLIDYQKFTYIVDVARLISASGSDEFESVEVNASESQLPL